MNTRDEIHDHLAIAMHYARVEIIEALNASRRNLTSLLRARSAQLQQTAAELIELEAELDATFGDPDWGMF